MNYYSNFVSLEGKEYEIQLKCEPKDVFYEATLSGDRPVVVEYHSTSNIFEPLKTSTCSISLLRDDYPMELFSGTATGTEAYLMEKKTREILWCGYLQPNLYNQGYSDPIETLVLEASDYISTLQYFKYEPQGKDLAIVSFQSILEHICDKFPKIKGFAVSNLGIAEDESLEPGTEDPIYLDELFISEANFFSKEGEPWSYQEVLQEMCRFLGFSAIQVNDKIYILDFSSISIAEFMFYYDKSKGYARSVIRPFNSKDITKDSYRLTGGDLSLGDVYNKITVKCNEYNVKNLLPDVNDKSKLRNLNGDFDKVISQNCVTHVTRPGPVVVGKAWYKIYDHSDWTSNCYTRGTQMGEKPTKVELTDKQRGTPNTWQNYIMPIIQDFAYRDKDDPKTKKVDFTRYLTLLQKNTPHCWVVTDTGEYMVEEGVEVPLFETSKIPPVIYPDDAYLVLSYDVEKAFFARQPFLMTSKPNRSGFENKGSDKNPEYWYAGMRIDKIDLTPAMTFKLRVSGKWWNGTKWQDTECSFQVKSEDLSVNDFFYTKKPVKNNISTEDWMDETGYKIKLPVNTNVADGMYLGICQPKPQIAIRGVLVSDTYGECGNEYTWISNLKMAISKRGEKLWTDDDVIYENVINENNVKEGPMITLKMTSSNDKSYSFSTVGYKTKEGKILPVPNIKRLGHSSAFQRPEENLVEQYVRQYQDPSKEETLTLDMSYGPFTSFQDTYWKGKWGTGERFEMNGVEIDYATDSQTFNLVQNKYDKKD